MISRRNFLKMTAAIPAIFTSKKVFASESNEKFLNMFNIHTGERLEIKYFQSGIYDKEALKKIDHFLRCHFTNDVSHMDVNLLNLLSNIARIVGKDKELEVISGYRSTQYNNYLINLGRRVSKNSLHLKGMAIDFAIPQISNEKLYDIACSLQIGGVGLYSNFIHIDTGNVRNWKAF